MKYEIGGGNRSRGEGFLNVDMLDCADIVCNLDETPWPIPDDSATEVYSSHCIEHVQCPHRFLQETARICQVGARVEIRCPDAMSELAMVAGHISVVSYNFMRHADRVFPEITWAGHKKKLKAVGYDRHADDYWYPKAKASGKFQGWCDEDLFDWVPRTCHEWCYFFVVVEYSD